MPFYSLKHLFFVFNLALYVFMTFLNLKFNKISCVFKFELRFQ